MGRRVCDIRRSAYRTLERIGLVTRDESGHLGDSNRGATVSAFAEHWDGSSWTHYQVPAPAGLIFYEPTLVGVHAAGSGDVWVGGNVDSERTGLDGFFSHWNGTDWATSDP